MRKVAIITDSTAYLPEYLVDELGIHVIPLTLLWGEDMYRDGVDIRSEEFYARLAEANILPTTSQPSVGEFTSLFSRLLDEGYAVLAMLISSGISGTVDSALQARDAFPGAAIAVVDSHLVAMPLGFMVMKVARAAQAGASLEECQALAEAVYSKIGVYFMVDDLKYLHMGGRINTAKRLLGSALDLKPIMELKEGKIELVESVRSRKKALARMLDLVERDIVGSKGVRIAAFHAAAEGEAQALLAQAVERFKPIETVTTFVSPVIGAHTGPGTVSIAYQME